MHGLTSHYLICIRRKRLSFNSLENMILCSNKTRFRDFICIYISALYTDNVYTALHIVQVHPTRAGGTASFEGLGTRIRVSTVQKKGHPFIFRYLGSASSPPTLLLI
jgi:hypothetical protein